MHSLEQDHFTWYFFPIYGLHIKRNKNWREFLFSDATIANGEDIRAYILTLKEKFHEDKDNLWHTFSADRSFIVIKIEKLFNDKTKSIILENATNRALEIIAIINFNIIFSSYYSFTITLGNEVYTNVPYEYTYYNSKGNSGFTTRYTKGEFLLKLPKEPFICSYKVLFNQLNKLPFKNLYSIIQDKNNIHYKEVRNALVNFYLVSNIPSATSQLVGSVTSIELLLKNATKYALIENRIKVLLGETCYRDFIEYNKVRRKRNSEDKLFGVFEKRHSVVHEGDNCNSHDAYRAIELFSLVLLGYTHICNNFQSKEEICTYLDLIYKYKYSDYYRKQDTFQLLVYHEKIKFSIDKIDWVARNLIDYYKLCGSEVKIVSKDKLYKVVYSLHKIRGITVSESCSIIQQLLYFTRLPHKNIRDFETEYNSLIDKTVTETVEEFIQGFVL